MRERRNSDAKNTASDTETRDDDGGFQSAAGIKNPFVVNKSSTHMKKSFAIENHSSSSSSSTLIFFLTTAAVVIFLALFLFGGFGSSRSSSISFGASSSKNNFNNPQSIIDEDLLRRNRRNAKQLTDGDALVAIDIVDKFETPRVFGHSRIPARVLISLASSNFGQTFEIKSFVVKELGQYFRNVACIHFLSDAEKTDSELYELAINGDRSQICQSGIRIIVDAELATTSDDIKTSYMKQLFENGFVGLGNKFVDTNSKVIYIAFTSKVTHDKMDTIVHGRTRGMFNSFFRMNDLTGQLEKK